MRTEEERKHYIWVEMTKFVKHLIVEADCSPEHLYWVGTSIQSASISLLANSEVDVDILVEKLFGESFRKKLKETTKLLVRERERQVRT